MTHLLFLRTTLGPAEHAGQPQMVAAVHFLCGREAGAGACPCLYRPQNGPRSYVLGVGVGAWPGSTHRAFKAIPASWSLHWAPVLGSLLYPRSLPPPPPTPRPCGGVCCECLAPPTQHRVLGPRPWLCRGILSPLSLKLCPPCGLLSLSLCTELGVCSSLERPDPALPGLSP